MIFFTESCCDILALLNVCYILHNIVLNMALLSFFLFGDLLAVVLGVILAVWSVWAGTLHMRNRAAHQASGEEKGKDLHDDLVLLVLPTLADKELKQTDQSRAAQSYIGWTQGDITVLGSGICNACLTVTG